MLMRPRLQDCRDADETKAAIALFERERERAMKTRGQSADCVLLLSKRMT